MELWGQKSTVVTMETGVGEEVETMRRKMEKWRERYGLRMGFYKRGNCCWEGTWRREVLKNRGKGRGNLWRNEMGVGV